MGKVSSQKQMEEVIKLTRKNVAEDAGTINAMIDSRFVACDFEAMTMDLAYPVKRWALNPAGVFHGGIIATILDIAMATLIFPYVDGFVPTISLTVNFIKPIRENDTLIVNAHILSIGKTIAHAEARAYAESTGKPVAAGNGVYSLKIWDSNLINR